MKKLLASLILSAVMTGAALAQVSPAQMRLEMISPVVRIVVNTDDGTDTGSGTVIYSGQRGGHIETYILTNNHVVAGAVEEQTKFDPKKKTDVKVEQSNQVEVDQFTYDAKGVLIATTSRPATVVAHDDDVDLAVVKLVDDSNTLPAAPVTKDDSVGVFDQVYAVGAGLGNPPFPSAGMIAQTDTEQSGHRFLQISAPIIMGNSGGALFRFEAASGHFELIGVPARVAAYARGLTGNVVDQNIGFAIPAATVRSFLKDERWDLGFIVDGDVPVAVKTTAKEGIPN